MSGWLPLLANLDFSRVTDLLTIAARVVVALVGAVIGWYVTGPVARLLFRLAFQRPIPEASVAWVKLAGALVTAVLVFLLFTFGLGGGGGFGFGGGGWGFGKGSGSEGDGKDKDKDAKEKDSKDRDVKHRDTKEVVPSKTLTVEIVVPRYEVEGTRRYYLVRDPAQTTFANVQEYQKHLKTLEAVGELLKKHPDRWSNLDIIIYPNGPESGGVLVSELAELAKAHKLSARRILETKERELPEK